MLDGEDYLRYPLFKVQDLKLRGKLVRPLGKPQQDTVMTEDDTDCRIRFLCYLPWYSVKCLHRAGTQPSSYPQNLQLSRTQLLEQASYFQTRLRHNNSTRIRVEHKVHMNLTKAEGLGGHLFLTCVSSPGVSVVRALCRKISELWEDELEPQRLCKQKNAAT